MKMNRLLVSLITLISASAFMSVAMAKPVALYDNPSDQAKIVGTVDLALGIIPIFSPKDSDWVKVADPRNGHVGWVKAKELSANGSLSFKTEFKADDDNGMSRSYNIIEFGNTNKKSNKELQAQLERLQEQQTNIQKTVNKSINNMVNDMNQLYKEYSQMMNEMGMPIIMPIMIPQTQRDVNTESKKQSVKATMGVGTDAAKADKQ